MPITQSTLATLKTFVESQSYTIVDNTSKSHSGYWTLACTHNADHDNFPVRLTTLKQHCRQGSNIVCPGCKHDTKIEKFCTASKMVLHSTPELNLLECQDCELTYRYTGNFYRPFPCFCKLRKRVWERAFYEALHEHFPNQLAREVVYAGKHKADIALYLDDITVFIEIDEIGHRYTPKKERDEVFQESFLAEREENQYLYRIDDQLVKDDLDETLADFLEWLENP